MMRRTALIAVAIAGLAFSGCAAKIAGTVKLVDQNSQLIANDKPNKVVVNMINTTAPLENASYSAITNPQGEFSSEGSKLTPGMYKVEVSRIGYTTSTQTIEVGKFGTKKVELFLRRIPEGKRKSIRSGNSDEDKIINPGEVNIQPPSM